MRAPRLPQRLRALARDERGVSVIEFAFLLPLMAFLIVGITDLSRGYASKLKLEQGVHRAVEKAMVATTQENYDYLKAEVAAATGVQQSAVGVNTWTQCGTSSAQLAFTAVCGDDEMTSRYLKVSVTSKYVPSFNYRPFGAIFATSTDGSVAQAASATLRLQ